MPLAAVSWSEALIAIGAVGIFIYALRCRT